MSFIPRKKGAALRHSWRKSAAALAAAGGMLAAIPATAGGPATFPVRSDEATLRELGNDLALLPRLAPNRQIVVATAQTFRGRSLRPASIRESLIPLLPAITQALSDDQARAIAEAIVTDGPVAVRVRDINQQWNACVIAMEGRAASAAYYANKMSGVPEALVRDHLPGTGRQWRLAVLIHEATHCGQSHSSNMFDITTSLSAEIAADQAVADAFEEMQGSRYLDIAMAVRDMRALSAVHMAFDTHRTAAGIFFNHEANDWRGRRPTGSRIAPDMRDVIDELEMEVARASTHRRDLFENALRDELERVARFTAAGAEATHPILSRRERLMADMRQRGPEAFILAHQANDRVLVRSVLLRVGSQLRARRGERVTYVAFSAAAQRLQERGAFSAESYAGRFLGLYIDAVNRRMPAPACTAPARRSCRSV